MHVQGRRRLRVMRARGRCLLRGSRLLRANLFQHAPRQRVHLLHGLATDELGHLPTRMRVHVHK